MTKLARFSTSAFSGGGWELIALDRLAVQLIAGIRVYLTKHRIRCLMIDRPCRIGLRYTTYQISNLLHKSDKAYPP